MGMTEGKSFFVGPLLDITKEDKVKAAKNICAAAMRRHKFESLAELTPRRRKKILEEIRLALRQLDLGQAATEYRETKEEIA